MRRPPARDINQRRRQPSTRVSSWVDFSPIHLEPAIWLDASDTSTIVESGNSVSQWNDKSGNGRNFVQATSANQMVTGVTTRNGLNVVTGNGSQWMTSSVYSPSTATFTMVGVARNAGRVYFSQGSNRHVGLTNNGDTSLFGGLYGSVAWIGNNAERETSLVCLNSLIRYSGVNRVRKNMSELVVTGGLTSSPNTASGSMWLGGDSVTKTACTICEIVIIDNYALSDAELFLLESYLTAKWGPF